MKLRGFLLTVILSGCNMDSAITSLTKCEEIYQLIEQSTEFNRPLQRAHAMQQRGEGCIATGMYDVWLAAYYQEGGDYPASVEIAQTALANMKSEDARPNLLQLLAEAELKMGNEAKAIQMAKAISHDYPSYSPIKYFLYENAIKHGKLPEALAYMEDVYKSEKSALSLMGMAAVLHPLGRHEETVSAVYKALEIEPERIGKVDGVLEGIFSLAILNRRSEAAELAKRHIAANLNWQDNPTFAQAAKELGVAYE